MRDRKLALGIGMRGWAGEQVGEGYVGGKMEMKKKGALLVEEVEELGQDNGGKKVCAHF